MPRWPLFLLTLLTVALTTPLGNAAQARLSVLPEPILGALGAVEDLPVEKRIQRAARDAMRGIRRAVRRSFYMQKYGPTWWWKWTRRLLPPVLFALLVLLADPGLLRTWKEDGLAAFATYAILTVYVYVRLLLSSEVRLALRLAVLASLVYGVWRADLIPDRFLTQIIPCRIDDFLFIGVAVRLFVYGCPEEAVERFANRAMARWRRIRAARRDARTQTAL